MIEKFTFYESGNLTCFLRDAKHDGVMISVLLNAVKGYVIGAANVVPGVSGGTMAYLLGIYERLLNAIKGFDLVAVKLACQFKVKEFLKRTDLIFLISIFLGVGLSFVTLAKLLKWGFEEHPLYVWSIFFGLVVASIPSLLKSVGKWSPVCIVLALIGLFSAGSMAFLTPANENANTLYLILCGVVAMASMIIPGLSGSFVLLLMGNYKLVMLNSVSALTEGNFTEALQVLIPVGIGAVLGVLLLSRALSWLFKTYHDQALSLIGGFVAGSLTVIWPWKEAVIETFVKPSGEVKQKITGFDNWRLPDITSGTDWIAIAFCVFGVVLLMLTEKLAGKKEQ